MLQESQSTTRKDGHKTAEWNPRVMISVTAQRRQIISNVTTRELNISEDSDIREKHLKHIYVKCDDKQAFRDSTESNL